MANPTISPYPLYVGLDGLPLDDGYLYFGVENLNPETNPIAIYWDAAGTQPAPQPIRTLGGYISRSGSAATVYVNVDYSITVKNKKGDLVYYAPKTTTSLQDGSITTDKLADGAVTTDKIADLAVTTDKIADLAVTEDKIAVDAVTSDKIQDGAITADKLALTANDSIRVDVASASVIDLSGSSYPTESYVRFTGTAGILTLTLRNGQRVNALFAASLPLTNSANLINLGGVDVVTAAGDTAEFIGEASSVTRMFDYARAASPVGSSPIIFPGGNLSTVADNSLTIPTGTWKNVRLVINNLQAAADYVLFCQFNTDTGARYNWSQCGTSGSSGVTDGASAQSGIAITRTTSSLADDSATPNPVDLVISIANPNLAIRHNLYTNQFFYQQANGVQNALASSGRWIGSPLAAITTIQPIMRGTLNSSPTGAVVLATAGTYYWICEAA